MRLPAALLAVTLSLLAPAAAHAQGLPPTITGIAPPTPIAAYNGQLVWSQPVAGGQYQLVSRTGSGAITALPVATRSIPFDVDLGPTSSGGVYAVYSRCATEPQWDQSGMPEYQTGKGCAIYKLDLGSMQEVRYSKVNASNASQYWPSYWKGRIGFARTYANKPDRGYVYTKTVASSTPSAQMPIGPLGTGQSWGQQLELYGSRLAFGWFYQSGSFNYFQLRLDQIGSSKSMTLDQTRGGISVVGLGWPAFGGGLVSWLRSCTGDPASCPGNVRLQRSSYSGGSYAEAATGEYTQAYDLDLGITYLENDVNSAYACGALPNSPGTCTITATQPSFTPVS